MPNLYKRNVFFILLGLLPIFLQGQRLNLTQVGELERALSTDLGNAADTAAIFRDLEPLRDRADGQRSAQLKWAYYMLLADGFSMYHDGINPRSDHYFALAQQLAENTRQKELRYVGLIRRGYYLFVYRNIRGAFQYFLRANDMKSEIIQEKVPLFTVHYRQIAHFYSHIGYNGKAREYLLDALPRADPKSREHVDILNAIGVYSKRDSLFAQAMEYLVGALSVASETKDSVWIGIVSGNIADLEWRSGNRDRAIGLIERNIELSNRFGEHLDAMRAHLRLAEMLRQQGRWSDALLHVEMAGQSITDKPYFLPFQTESKRLLSEIARATGDRNGELSNLRDYLFLRDSLESRMDAEKLQRATLRYDEEKHVKDLESAELKRDHTNQRTAYLLVFSVLVLVIMLLLVNGSKNRISAKNAQLRAEQAQLAGEKQLIEGELMALNGSLQVFSETIRQNELTIQRFRNEVLGNLEYFPEHQVTLSDSLSRALRDQVMTEDSWVKFMGVFNRVYPGYLEKQRQRSGTMSETEARLLALAKLGIPNQGKAHLLGISLEGVKKAQQRLRKKMGLRAGASFDGKPN